jgi:DNA polymerase III, alpha subunit
MAQERISYRVPRANGPRIAVVGGGNGLSTMIEKMGFTDYFLIVSDFVRYAKSQKIPVGPGRGSAAGSMIWL